MHTPDASPDTFADATCIYRCPLYLQHREGKGRAAGAVPVIDCIKAGYYKVLGKGTGLGQAFIVKAKFFSRRAEEKIREAGGACVTVA